MRKTIGIFCRTYSQDAARLRFLLKSIERFTTGFDGVTVACAADSMEAVEAVIREFPLVSLAQCDRTVNDYVGQQITKLKAPDYAPYDLITHIDSDCVFQECLDASELLFEDKPILYMTSYDSFYHNGDWVPWQPVTSFFARKQINYEFMRQFPLTYPREMYADLERWLMRRNGFGFDGIPDRVHGNLFSEFNLMGAFSHIHEDLYHKFYDTKDVPVKSKVRQFWANEMGDRSINDADHTELMEILSS